MIFNIEEQDAYYERYIEECKAGWWLDKQELIKKVKISPYLLEKITPAIEELENSYEIIRRLAEDKCLYHYGRLEQFRVIYNAKRRKIK